MKPLIPTTHLTNLTDNFGVWQHHEDGKILESEGYALDDSARALIVFYLYNQKDKAEVCLSYLENSVKDGNMVGFFWGNKEVRTFPSSIDALGLAYWALAYCIQNNFHAERAQAVINQINIDILYESEHIRPQSYALIAESLLGNKAKAKELAKKIADQYKEEWRWFEPKLVYGNAIIPYALIIYSQQCNDYSLELREKIQKSILTLEKYSRIGIIPAPVGNTLWQEIGKPQRDPYGQQPIDAGFMVMLLVKAYHYFKEEIYRTKAHDWLDWFHGNNIMQKSLINADSACADGIDEAYISTHYGAESTIVYLWAEYEYSTIA